MLKMSSIQGLIEHSPYIGIFLLLILGGIGLPFPEDTTLILCGFLISQDIIRPVRGLVVVYSGLLLADYFLYAVGKKYGRMIVTHRRFRRIISPERLSALEEKFNKRGALVILFGRHLFGLRAQIFLVAGVMRMSALKFLMADAVASVFTMAVMVGAGYIGGNSLQILKKDITKIEYIAVLLAIVLLVVYLIYKYLSLKRR